MQRVLFLCTGNSCRSQMAEGWDRHFNQIEPSSARLNLNPLNPFANPLNPFANPLNPFANPLNPFAVQVMAEAGIDIGQQQPKHVDEVQGSFDYVVTVCDWANEACPMLPGKARRLHVGFDDPPRLARIAKTEADKIEIYRRVRDEIRALVERMPGNLEPGP